MAILSVSTGGHRQDPVAKRHHFNSHICQTPDQMCLFWAGTPAKLDFLTLRHSPLPHTALLAVVLLVDRNRGVAMVGTSCGPSDFYPAFKRKQG